MTVKGGTTPACAACKYQRRKCRPTCQLAPYFPANQPKMFQNVHRLFGVCNVTKVLKRLKTKDQRDDAMKSIKYEADMRQRFPIHGCSAVLAQLRFQLAYKTEELRVICMQLAACREQTTTPRAPPQLEFGSSSSNDVPFQIPLEFDNGFYGDNMVYGDNTVRMCLNQTNSNDDNNLAAIEEQLNSFKIQEDRNIFTNPQDFEEAMIVERSSSHFETKETFDQSRKPNNSCGHYK